MARDIRNIGASVRARLLRLAQEKRADFQIYLARYAIERLLYRLSVSRWRDRFILKGAMLFAVYVDDPFRPTRDLDLLGVDAQDAETMIEQFREICGASVPNDGVVFDIKGLSAQLIRHDMPYGGLRVRTVATIDRAHIPIQIDIGFGDAVSPEPAEIDYPSLLDAPAPRLRAYALETVIAEKFEALVTLGMANSRMKDFYDLWMISRTFGFSHQSLADAVQATFARRGIALPLEAPTGLTNEFASAHSAQWRAFLNRDRMAAAPAALDDIVAGLQVFLMPLTEARTQDTRWTPDRGWHRQSD